LQRGQPQRQQIAALKTYAPNARRVGLSATVKDEMGHAHWLSAQGEDDPKFARIVRGSAGAKPEVTILNPEDRIPWAG
ncbi:hypothetical protein INQ30_29925, partial [Escherichia coli]|nr:hypothetical protein [Escherichia coli]